MLKDVRSSFMHGQAPANEPSSTVEGDQIKSQTAKKRKTKTKLIYEGLRSSHWAGEY